MNPINATLEDLKTEARNAGRRAAEEPTDHERDLALIRAFARNVKAAHADDVTALGLDGYALATLLNAKTTRAFERAVKQRGTYDVDMLYTIGQGPTRTARMMIQAIDLTHAEKQARAELHTKLVKAGHLDPDGDDLLDVVKVNMEWTDYADATRLTTPDTARLHVSRKSDPYACDFIPEYADGVNGELLGHTYRDRPDAATALYGWVTVDGWVGTHSCGFRADAARTLTAYVKEQQG